MFSVKQLFFLALFFTGVNAVAIPAATSDSFWLSIIPRSTTDPDSEAVSRAVQTTLKNANETTTPPASAAAHVGAAAAPVSIPEAAAAKTHAVVNDTTTPPPQGQTQQPMHFLNNEVNQLVGGPSGKTPGCHSSCQPLWVEVVNVCNRDLHCTCNNTVAAQLESCYNCDLHDRHANWMSVFAIQRTFNAYSSQCLKIGQPIKFLRATAMPVRSGAIMTSVKLVSVVASVGASFVFLAMA